MTGPRVYGESGEAAGELLRIHGPSLPVIIRNPGGPAPGFAPFLERDALIDTGASDICISRAIARELQLAPVDSTMMGVVGGSVEATIYAGELEIPELRFRRTLQMYSPKTIAPHSHVLLGRSFLRFFVITYDGPSGIFHFHPAGAAPAGPIDDE